MLSHLAHLCTIPLLPISHHVDTLAVWTMDRYRDHTSSLVDASRWAILPTVNSLNTTQQGYSELALSLGATAASTWDASSGHGLRCNTRSLWLPRAGIQETVAAIGGHHDQMGGHVPGRLYNGVNDVA